MITATLFFASPIPGVPGDVRCATRAAQRKLHAVERAAACAFWGCPLDSCYTTSELIRDARKTADAVDALFGLVRTLVGVSS